MIGGRGFLRFVLIAITKMDILYMFYHFQDPIKVIRRYEGCHYTRLESYYIIFYFETDWSRIRPLPSTTLNAYNINLDNVLAFVSESAQYMRKAYKDTLHGIIPNSYHVCCVAHMLSLVLEILPTIFKEMNTLVTLIKRVFCQSPLRCRLHVS